MDRHEQVTAAHGLYKPILVQKLKALVQMVKMIRPSMVQMAKNDDLTDNSTSTIRWR